MGMNVLLLVPGPQPDNLPVDMWKFRVEWLGAAATSKIELDRKARYQFCEEACERVNSAIKQKQVDLVHVLFGLFLMEVLDTNRLFRKKIPSIATVHNTPPMECRRSWSSDKVYSRFIDAIRIRVVSVKNNLRLRKHSYSEYVTPSDQVRESLLSIIPSSSVNAISHGVSDSVAMHTNIPSCRRPKPHSPVQIFTAGGWVPHKRQHLIPQVADQLRGRGIKFVWHVVGPAARVPGYKEAIDGEILTRKLQHHVHTHEAVSNETLMSLYERANLYVQPSTEEGFCITALDAAAMGLPVIGSPAGALPIISAISGGSLAASEPAELANSIASFVKYDKWPVDTSNQCKEIRAKFTWAQSAKSLLELYEHAELPDMDK